MTDVSSVEELKELIDIPYGTFERKGMRMNVDKTKIMVFERNDCTTESVIKINGKKVE